MNRDTFRLARMTEVVSKGGQLIVIESTLPTTSTENQTGRKTTATNFMMHWLLLAAMLFLIVDRLQLCRHLLFAYLDEDQAIEWYAAHEFLHGHIPEPCFYGQAYNTCLEGVLAAPGVALGVPYWIAVPAVSVLLGLLPYLVLSIYAYKRQRFLASLIALLVPLLLSTRYAIITGIPRGFITGIAVAMIPAMLWLPKALSKTKDGLVPLVPAAAGNGLFCRALLAALTSVVALIVNPNSVVLLLPVGVYALLTYGKSVRFWIGSLLGIIAAAPYQAFIYWFYYIHHNDYLFYHRNYVVEGTIKQFTEFLPKLPLVFYDLTPAGTPMAYSTYALAGVFSLLGIYLGWRHCWSALAGLMVGTAFVMVALAFNRVQDGRTSAFYPYSRMFLALPVLFTWLLVIPSGRKRMHSVSKLRWIGPMALVLIGCWAFLWKQSHLEGQIASELDNVQMVTVMSVETAIGFSRDIDRIARQQHASFILLPNSGSKRWTYVLPLLTACETLFPDYERRTWRLHEESFPRYQRILIMDPVITQEAHILGYADAGLASHDAPVTVMSTRGHSVIHICQDLGVHIRPFTAPSHADLLRPITLEDGF